MHARGEGRNVVNAASFAQLFRNKKQTFCQTDPTGGPGSKALDNKWVCSVFVPFMTNIGRLIRFRENI